MLNEYLLVEKYRPKTVEDFIGDDSLIKMIKTIIKEPSKIPHLLLVSQSAGTGKTSLAKLIVRLLKSDVLYMNASDERGIDTIRGKVKEFASTVSFNQDSPKIVHLDEADGLTKDAQNTLRNMMEEYAFNCRFILTCNNQSKIIEPLQSRCKIIQFTNPPKDKILSRLEFICKEEKIEIGKDKLDTLVDASYPDIRSMVKNLDTYRLFGIGDDSSVPKIIGSIYDLLKQKKLVEARKIWLSAGLNYGDALKRIYERVWIDDVDDNTKQKMIYEIAEGSYRIVMGADPEITFARTMMGVIKCL